MRTIKLILIAVFFITISSCHKDIDEDKRTTTPTPTAKIFKETTSSILGYVYDENNQPIENANVSLYSAITKTDKYGVFSFKNVKMDKLGTYIKVEKSGYLLGSDMLYPDKSLNFSYIHMYSFDKTGEFDSDKGGTIEMVNGGTIAFTPNSIVKDDGSDYNGKVIITAKRLDLNDERLGDKMPGALVGINKKGNTAILGTSGMIAVELRDNSGGKLNIKQGKYANISIPVSNTQLNNAPDEIPLWYFDENKGIWIEEGSAILQDGNFVADLPHFSWWNLDAKFDPIYMCVKVLFENGKPAVNFQVNLTADVIYPTSYGTTDSNGKVCGLVPKGMEILLEVINPFCNKVVYKKTIGPFTNNVTLDDIVLPSPNYLAKGKVVCNGDPIKNARVILKYITEEDANRTILTNTDENGNFDFDFSLQNCDYVKSASIFAYNPTTGDASPDFDLNLVNTNNLEINICHNCDFSIELIPTYGTLCDAKTLFLEAKVIGSGTFKYLWSNGETGTKVDNLENSTYCVTVTETVAECDAVKCVKVYSDELSQIDSIVNHPYCGINNGSFSLYTQGGVAPYTTEVSGPNGFALSADSEYVVLKDLASGVYISTVTDAGGCSKTLEIQMIEDKGHDVIIDVPQFECDSATLRARVLNSTNLGSVTYKWSDGQEGQSITVNSSGKYCVTATEGAGCKIDTCMDIEIESDVHAPLISDCSKNIYKIVNEEKYPLIINGNIIEPNETFDYDVLEYGFAFVYYYEGAMCGEIENEIALPHLTEGITIDSTISASCPDCKDGHIYFTINSSYDCVYCEVGSSALYSIDDLDTDLSSENNAGTLDTGYYYIVVTNKNNDCFIAYKKVYVDDKDPNKCMIPELKDKIIAYYPFSTGNIEDYSGFNHDLIAETQGQNVPVNTYDRNGNPKCAYAFNKGIEIADFISIDTNILENTTDFSVSLWYQPLGDRDSAKYEGLIKVGNFMSLGLADCRKAVFSLDEYDVSCWDDENVFGCDKAMTNHEWHHLVATYNITDSGFIILKLYRNGELAGTVDWDINNEERTGKLTIGEGFEGKMDDIIIYSRTLKPLDVKKLYSMGTCCE